MKYFCVRLFQNFHQVTQAVQCCRGWLHSRPSFHLRLQLYLDNQQQICWNCQFWKYIESMLELSEQTGVNKIKQEPLIHRDHQSPLSKTAQTFGPGSMCKTTWIRCSIFNRHAQCLNDFPFVICKWRISLKKMASPGVPACSNLSWEWTAWTSSWEDPSYLWLYLWSDTIATPSEGSHQRASLFGKKFKMSVGWGQKPKTFGEIYIFWQIHFWSPKSLGWVGGSTSFGSVPNKDVFWLASLTWLTGSLLLGLEQ